MHSKSERNFTGFIIILTLLLLCEIICVSGLGYISISPMEILQIFQNNFFSYSPETTNELVLLEVRLPRIFCAILVGGSLGLAGCVFQGVLLNPLADPYTLGVSSGAALGASLALLLTLFGISTADLTFLLPFSAFICAIMTLSFVFFLCSSENFFSSQTLILSGVIVAAILSAAIGFIKHLAAEQVNVIIFWLMGSLTGKTWQETFLLTIFLGPCFLIFLRFAKDMNILSFGHKTAYSLGVHPVKTSKILLASATLLTSICVCLSGIIGFVGLIIPHLLRTVLGADNRLLLPASFIGGAILLLSADTITRVFLPNEVPIGVLTALLGGPFFCYIFKTRLKQKI